MTGSRPRKFRVYASFHHLVVDPICPRQSSLSVGSKHTQKTHSPSCWCFRPGAPLRQTGQQPPPGAQGAPVTLRESWHRGQRARACQYLRPWALSVGPDAWQCGAQLASSLSTGTRASHLRLVSTAADSAGGPHPRSRGVLCCHRHQPVSLSLVVSKMEADISDSQAPKQSLNITPESHRRDRVLSTGGEAQVHGMHEAQWSRSQKARTAT